MVVDYDSAPERYRLGMAVTRAHSSASLYAEVASRLVALGAQRVLDVGGGDGPLRAELPAGPELVGLDAAAAMVRCGRAGRCWRRRSAGTTRRSSRGSGGAQGRRSSRGRVSPGGGGLRARGGARWDAPLVTLPDAAAVRDHLLGRQAPPDAATRAAEELRPPVRVTKRGALVIASSGAA
ncbi:hypothetical protein [Modestobacter marinus]|uniref:hypothetical protein n=1 Tax=Modestobacter marinus TaxID=477641 RepID=UPI001C96296F|nr:hypothetical protein [Modestobacter marinus]